MKTTHLLLLLCVLALSLSTATFGAEGRQLIHRELMLSPQALADLQTRYAHLDEADKKAWGPALNQLLISRELYATRRPRPLDSNPGRTGEGEENKDEDTLLSRLEMLNKVVDQFIVLGDKIIALVKRGEPMRNLNFETLKVLPFEDDGQTLKILQTEHWQPAQAVHYQVVYKNFYGVEVVNFTYSVGMSAGGSYEGKGKYLTGVYAAPDNLLLRWGFNFNAQSKLLSVTNLGSKEDPRVGLTLGITYDVFNMLNSSYSVDRFLLTGDNQIKYLGP